MARNSFNTVDEPPNGTPVSPRPIPLSRRGRSKWLGRFRKAARGFVPWVTPALQARISQRAQLLVWVA
jgi:hypothetical protein